MKRTVADVTSDADIQNARKTARQTLSQRPKILSDDITNSLVGLYWSFKGNDGKIKKLGIGMELSSRLPVWFYLEKKLDEILQNIRETTVFKSRLNNRRHYKWKANGKRYLICGLSKVGISTKYKPNGKIETKSNRGKNASSKSRSSRSTTYVDCHAKCIIGIKACQQVQEEQVIFQCGRCLRTFKSQYLLDTHNNKKALCRKKRKKNGENSQKPKKKKKKKKKKLQDFVIAVLDVKHEHCVHELRYNKYSNSKSLVLNKTPSIVKHSDVWNEHESTSSQLSENDIEFTEVERTTFEDNNSQLSESDIQSTEYTEVEWKKIETKQFECRTKMESITNRLHNHCKSADNWTEMCEWINFLQKNEHVKDSKIGRIRPNPKNRNDIISWTNHIALQCAAQWSAPQMLELLVSYEQQNIIGLTNCSKRASSEKLSKHVK